MLGEQDVGGVEGLDPLAYCDRMEQEFRAVWDEQIEGTIAHLNYQEQFTDRGESWAEADAEGNLVVRSGADDVSG